MPTVKKNETIDKLRERVAGSRDLFFTDMRGLTVGEMRSLRQALRKESATYAVVKNTLFQIAIGDEKRALFENVLVGPTGVAFVGDDPIGVAKALTKFADESKKLQIKAAYVEGRYFGAAEVVALSKIPRRLELIAKLIGSVRSPLYGLVGVLSGNQRKLVGLLEVIRVKKSEI